LLKNSNDRLLARAARNGRVAAWVCLLALALEAQTNVLTYHNDNAHTGQYLTETLLTPANVNAAHFGWRAFLVTDGLVYAQPLYLTRVKIPGKGLRNVLYVVTSHDSVYAFDADDVTAPPLWMVNFLDAAHGIGSVSSADVGCTVIPELGITGTPVIDAASGTIYLIAETKEAGNQFVFRLHALDVTTGAERPGSPVEINPPGFNAAPQKHRASLLLSNGVVYTSWSGHCDLGSYHGYVMAHDAATLQLMGVFNDTPGSTGGSFWNGGAGPAADAEGNIYVVSSNGDFNGVVSPGSLDQAVLKLAPAPALKVLDSFTPFNRLNLDIQDLDMGSAGAVILPDEAGTSEHRHLIFTCAKEGRMYLLDRDALGGPQSGSDSKALDSLPFFSHSTFGSAAYFNGSIYVAPEFTPMMKFPVANASLDSSPAAQAPDVLAGLGATPGISANGQTNGIVWITTFNKGGELFAYDAKDLRKLYDSNAQPNSRLYSFTEFTTPTIADGKVFVPTAYGIGVYGESAPKPVVVGIADGASFSADALAPGSLISIFGTGLAATTAGAQSVPLPLSIDDVAVTINGIRAPVLYVSPQQLNVQIPQEVAAGPTKLMVQTLGQVSNTVDITLKPAAPALFIDPLGQAAALDPDGSSNSAQSPAPPGSVVSFFFTGLGPISGSIDDGDAPKAGGVVWTASPVTATIGGKPAEVEFAGLAPGYPGVAQINLKIPALAPGTYPVAITVSGAASNTAQVVVSQ
jgi:uncharacterized protein (TIGR03437 family)